MRVGSLFSGIGGAGEPMYTLDGTSQHAVAYVPEMAFALAARNAKGVSTLESQNTLVAVPQVRRLTPLECERLQGFPDSWTDNGQADSHRYRQLGNAVAVPVAEWIAQRIAGQRA